MDGSTKDVERGEIFQKQMISDCAEKEFCESTKVSGGFERAGDAFNVGNRRGKYSTGGRTRFPGSMLI